MPAAVTAAAKSKRPAGVASVDIVASVRCCNWSADLSADAVDVSVEAGGRELAKATCDECGSEYTLGVLTRTREESLASEAFEHVSEEVLEEAGVDKGDYEPSIDEPAMCFGCDGSVDRRADWCAGCKEFVCSGCRRYLQISARRHQADAHTTAPKAKEASTGAGVDEPVGDDGDFRAER